MTIEHIASIDKYVLRDPDGEDLWSNCREVLEEEMEKREKMRRQMRLFE